MPPLRKSKESPSTVSATMRRKRRSSGIPGTMVWAASLLLLLPLRIGADSLWEENRTAIAPGITLTRITRAAASNDAYWTIGVLIPTQVNSLSLLASQDRAREIAVKLRESGFDAKVREERNPEYRDLPAGTLGYSVRVGRYDTREAAAAAMPALSGLGYRAMVLFTGDDGDTAVGPLEIRVLTVDPDLFRGEITPAYGRWIVGRTKTSALADEWDALAAVNAGFFVMSGSDGAPGEPAGVLIKDGKLLSEATNGRIAMCMFNSPGRGPRVSFEHLTTTMHIAVGEHGRHTVDGINRKPGLIRNCGGTGDTPTDSPRHDFTCKDADELIVITPEFGAAAPAGDGIEAVVDESGIVTQIRGREGGAVPDGRLLIQGIGSEAAWLSSNLAPGTKVRLEVSISDSRGRRVEFGAGDSAINGGPGLVANGRREISPVADGLVHPDDPSFFLRWGIRRNPRTMAGVDSRQRILLVTVDGHQPGRSVGMSLIEAADLMVRLGAVTAMNLDGGGSTAMVVSGKLVNSPSDPAGERPVGDAVLIRSVPLERAVP